MYAKTAEFPQRVFFAKTYRERTAAKCKKKYEFYGYNLSNFFSQKYIYKISRIYEKDTNNVNLLLLFKLIKCKH